MTGRLENLGAWAQLPFFRTRWPTLENQIQLETPDALPPADVRFSALERTCPNATRVVILGQDPYPTPGHANGLAFSVTSGTPLPRSLANIFAELERDIGGRPVDGNLEFWSDQGVLLLNTALTTPPHQAGGHAHLGWQDLTREVLSMLNDRPRAFMLWGNHARGFRSCLENDEHLILESAHPSPLSARRGFFDSRPFSKVNEWLSARGDVPIDWAGKKVAREGGFSPRPERGI